MRRRGRLCREPLGSIGPTEDERREMNLIRTSAWVVLVLGAVAGCTGEEGTTPSSNPAPPNPTLAPKTPVVPSQTKSEPSKEGASKEMEPAPAKPGETK